MKRVSMVLSAALVLTAYYLPGQSKPGERCVMFESIPGESAWPPRPPQLRSGEQCILLKNGDELIRKIVDVSSARLVLELEDGTEIPLRDLWMINFVNTQKDFPREIEQIETAEHYVFLKNGGVSSGKIVDFSSEQRVFEFESGEKFPIGQCRRIYFLKKSPFQQD